MKIQKFDNEQDWLDARRGRITGSTLKDLISKRDGSPKAGFYELIAQTICVPASEERAIFRGQRLEDEAIEQFSKMTGKKVDNELVIWSRDEDERIAVSPDGSIGKTEAVEVKCLSSARHIEVWMTKEIPTEYDLQVLQYFIVNDKLKKLYFVFYDPRMPIALFHIEVTRNSIKDLIAEYLDLERKVLERVTEVERQIVF